MAATQVQSRTADIVVPSIHLGSFSPYPVVSSGMKQAQRFSESNPVPVVSRDELTYPYATQRNQSPWRSNSTPHPATQSSVYKTYPANRPSYTPSNPSGRMSRSYSPGPQGQSSTLAVQPPTSPAQIPGPPRELCLECMMRDEDMADVDVTSPGVWERESDVWYRELCQREEEEERDRSQQHSSSSGVSSSTDCVRPRARGARLTESNLIVWLNLNPTEPASRQQTLNNYLDSQNHLLRAEHKARLQAMQESRQIDEKIRDTYSELRRSVYDLGASASADDRGIKIRSPKSTAFGDDPHHQYNRDTTLLENGLIVERVDIRKEEARLRKEERRARKASRDSLTLVDNRDRERDAMSLYSYRAVEGPASIRSAAPYESTISVPMPTSRSVRSMYTTPSTPWQQTIPSRPLSMAPGSLPTSVSQTSLASAGSPRKRFFGMKQWSGYFGSNVSLAQSGSMLDMHLGLDQDKQLAPARQVDIGSNAPSLRQNWPHDENKERRNPDNSSATTSPKKKKRGIGRLWKIITGSSAKAQETARPIGGPSQEVEDEDLPLAPPPPLSYLVNRSSAQSERSVNMIGTGRHVSMPSLSFSNGGHQLRSNSLRSTTGVGLSSPSDQSSPLPSPTEVRYSYRESGRDSGGDSPEDAHYDEVQDSDTLNRKRSMGLDANPSRPPFIANISEPNFHANSIATPTSFPSITRQGSSSSPLVPTVKTLPYQQARPISMLSLDKSLPPLPLDDPDVPLPNPYPPNSAATFEDAAARRQSFNGLTSRSALPLGAGRATNPGMVAYDEFGASRHSLAVFDSIPDNTTSKRKSRFGLGSLLGRKDKPANNNHRRDASATTLPNARLLHPTRSDAFLGQQPRSSLSERSSSLQPMIPQQQAAPRRTLEEHVLQESDFLAYRYPSKSERLNPISRS